MTGALQRFLAVGDVPRTCKPLGAPSTNAVYVRPMVGLRRTCKVR